VLLPLCPSTEICPHLKRLGLLGEEVRICKGEFDNGNNEMSLEFILERIGFYEHPEDVIVGELD